MHLSNQYLLIKDVTFYDMVCYHHNNNHRSYQVNRYLKFLLVTYRVFLCVHALLRRICNKVWHCVLLPWELNMRISQDLALCRVFSALFGIGVMYSSAKVPHPGGSKPYIQILLPATHFRGKLNLRELNKLCMNVPVCQMDDVPLQQLGFPKTYFDT